MTRRQRNSVLVTGGPTRAYLDDVRFLSNYSTGELAYEICKHLKKAGFEVHAVLGPSHFPFESLRLGTCRRVETIHEMRAEVMRLCHRKKPTAAIFSAAVLDFIPARTAKGKVSSRSSWTVRLVPAPKIIDEVGNKFPKIRRVGFKLEARATSRPAREKLGRALLKKKNLDAICVNYLSEIRGRRHPALLFRRETDRATLASSKIAIARWISRTVGSMQGL